MDLAKLALAVALTTGCYDARHASVTLPHNPAGADCFAACGGADSDAAQTACVAACPGARADTGPCDGDGLACAQTRALSRWKTAGWVVLSAVALAAVAR